MYFLLALVYDSTVNKLPRSSLRRQWGLLFFFFFSALNDQTLRPAYNTATYLRLEGHTEELQSESPCPPVFLEVETSLQDRNHT